MASTTFSGPVTSTAGFISGADSIVSATTATLTATAAAHSGRTVLLDRAAGQAVTLPAATGTGNSYKFFVLTTITSNTTTIKVVDATDVMAGVAIVAAQRAASNGALCIRIGSSEWYENKVAGSTVALGLQAVGLYAAPVFAGSG